ncbi:MAG: hypothetical protein ABIH28_02275 [archaeon]
MYNTTQIVGDFFEQKLMNLFELIRTDSKALGIVPDLISKDDSFYVEVKASAYDNGGVINMGQLYRFDRKIDIRRFYAFAYHSINRHMQRDYPTEKELRKALNLKSLFLFPFSITKAHFERCQKRHHPRHDTFVQLKESLAQRIFEEEDKIWKHLGLEQKNYKMTKPHEKINIITREGYLEQQILNLFHPEFL